METCSRFQAVGLSLAGLAAMLSECARGYFKDEQREGGYRAESGSG